MGLFLMQALALQAPCEAARGMTWALLQVKPCA